MKNYQSRVCSCGNDQWPNISMLADRYWFNCTEKNTIHKHVYVSDIVSKISIYLWAVNNGSFVWSWMFIWHIDVCGMERERGDDEKYSTAHNIVLSWSLCRYSIPMLTRHVCDYWLRPSASFLVWRFDEKHLSKHFHFVQPRGDGD